MSELLSFQFSLLGSPAAGEPVIEPPDPPVDSGDYPLLATVRVSTFNYTQSGSLAATDRKAMGLLDYVLLGGFFGTPQDSTPPPASYISRTDVTQEILDAHFNAFGTNDIHIATYVVQMTTNTDGTFGDKCFAEAGPNGTDWWYRDAGGAIVSASGESPGDGGFVNISDQITLDAQGRNYCDYYADERVIAELMDVHAAAGIGAGEGGMSPWYDNLGIHMKKSSIDPDQDGQNDDMQEYYDPDNAAHVAAEPKAVQFIGEYRANQRSGIDRVAASHPGILKGGNHNQWYESYSGPATSLPYVMKEYRLDENDINSKSFTQHGLSENNNWRPTELKTGWMRSHTLWTGVSSASGGNWQQSYNSIAMPAWAMSSPAIMVGEWVIEALQPSTNGPAGRPIWPNIPASGSGTAWNAHRWAMGTCCLAGAHYAPSCVIDQPTSTIGERRTTVLFDEMGLVNGSTDYGFGTGGTKLTRKWMGAAIDPPQTAAWSGSLWIREFENGLVIVNTNWDDTAPAETVVVANLPGGATEWTRIIGTQDSSWNDGTDASSNFTIPSIDGIFLARKSYYDAL